MDSGLLYICGDDEFLQMATRSARTARKYMPDTPIAIITDADTVPSVFDNQIDADLEPYGYRNKPATIHRSPFDRTLFVDHDTYFTCDVSGLFDILDEFQLAVAHAPNRVGYNLSGVPNDFVQMNTGVLLFKTVEVQTYFSNWQTNYSQLREKKGIDADQPSFRKTIYESDIRYYTLPPEYNCRTPYPGYLKRRAAILHGGHQEFGSIVDKINKRENESRVHLPGYSRDTISVLTRPRISTLPRAAYQSISRDGVIETVNKTLERLKSGRVGQ